MRRRPSEYGGMALCAAIFGMILAFAGVWRNGPAAGPHDAVLRTVAVLLCTIAFVAAEAIWRVRPWAYLAGKVLAWSTLACFLLPAAWALLEGEFAAAMGLVVFAGMVALIVMPMVGYLRRTHPQLHPRPRPHP